MLLLDLLLLKVLNYFEKRTNSRAFSVHFFSSRKAGKELTAPSRYSLSTGERKLEKNRWDNPNHLPLKTILLVFVALLFRTVFRLRDFGEKIETFQKQDCSCTLCPCALPEKWGSSQVRRLASQFAETGTGVRQREETVPPYYATLLLLHWTCGWG